MKSILYEFGGIAPGILIILSWILLWDKPTLFFYYTIGVFIDTLLNLILKGIFKQPRPLDNLREFNLALNHGQRFMFKDRVLFDIFGMPSGHAESLMFSTAFIYLSLKKTNILYLYCLISLIAMAERVIFKFHTPLQIIVGAIVGTLFGMFMYYLSGQKVKGRITPRQDDYGPL